jgi:hypothetical protein
MPQRADSEAPEAEVAAEGINEEGAPVEGSSPVATEPLSEATQSK